VGGNHRHEAALKNNCKEFMAIVVPCNELEFEILSKSLNAVEGQRLSRQQRIDQAVGLVNTRGMSSAEVGRALNVPRAMIDKKLRTDKVIMAAANLGVILPESVAPTTLDMLVRHSKSAPLFIAASDFVAKQNPSGDKLKEINAAVDLCPTEATKIAVFKKFTEASTAKTAKSGHVVSRPVRSSLLHALTMLETLTNSEMTRCKLQIETHEVLPLLAKLKKAYQDLYEILIST
jgi:hypothetical protein